MGAKTPKDSNWNLSYIEIYSLKKDHFLPLKAYTPPSPSNNVGKADKTPSLSKVYKGTKFNIVWERGVGNNSILVISRGVSQDF